MLRTPSPRDKAALTDEIAALWAKGDITVAYDPDPDAKHEAPPDKPARYARPSSSSRRGRNLVPTRAAPRFGGPNASARRGRPEKRETLTRRIRIRRIRNRASSETTA